MRWTTLFLSLAFALRLLGEGRAADKPFVLDVWPDKVPGEKGDIGE